METITELFDQCRRQQKIALILYATMGFPSRRASLALIQALAEAGADMIELGVPFSDPVADGPSIQYASQSALDQGITLEQILADAASLQISKPLVLMSYLNPLRAYGWERLFPRLYACGIRGLIIPDLPVEEATQISDAAADHQLDLILLAAPTSPADRIRRITAQSRGFVYCVSAAGTTGSRPSLDAGLNKFLTAVRQATDKPIAVGFGISRAEHVRELRGRAEGVIVGSRIVEAVRNQEDVKSIVAALRVAAQGG